MIRGIYTTAGGMIASQQRLDVLSSNLANMSTTGYKSDGVTFAESCEKEMRANGGLGESLGTIGSGPVQTGGYTNFGLGPVTQTGNPLDVAISSPAGAFAVEVPQADGTTTTAYTRDGSFTLDSARQLVTKQGYPVLDSSQRPITLPQGTADISESGVISVDGKTVATLGVYSGQFVKITPNLFTTATGPDGRATDTTALTGSVLKTQSIEGSNVDPIKSMVDMITINRSYELGQKSIQKQDDMTEKLIQSLSSQG